MTLSNELIGQPIFLSKLVDTREISVSISSFSGLKTSFTRCAFRKNIYNKKIRNKNEKTFETTKKQFGEIGILWFCAINQGFSGKKIILPFLSINVFRLLSKNKLTAKDFGFILD